MAVTRRRFLRCAAFTLAMPPAIVQAVPGKVRADRLSRLQTAMAEGRFVTYQPSALHYFNGKPTPASRESIAADLKTLRPWFDSLITYGALEGAEHVPDVAAGLGYRAIVMGVWDFDNPLELHNALVAAAKHPSLVVGVSLGNELILGKRGSWGDLSHALTLVHRKAPDVPLTVTEAFAQFLDDPDAKAVFAKMDFMLVNIHPIFESWFRHAKPANWADFVARAADLLAAKYPGPILVKETGVPTGPASAGYTQTMQHDFYRALEKRFPPTAKRAFSYFAAFDAPWRVSDFIPGGGVHPEEAHWGLFTEARTPKAVMSDLPRLASARGPASHHVRR